MNEKTFTIEEIEKALYVAGIRLTLQRNKFFDALLPEPEPLTEKELIDMTHYRR